MQANQILNNIREMNRLRTVNTALAERLELARGSEASYIRAELRKNTKQIKWHDAVIKKLRTELNANYA
jgi:hypothetical protein